ncbi:hypothetical protein [Novosphingobium gossypii]|uniref:hypothetical protein n=1 Tax=Novosphingobium gossypii TaxID=1604774 RepID=UPI003D19D1BE
MGVVIIDGRRNPPTIYENVDVALARQYRDQAREAGENAGSEAAAVVGPLVGQAQAAATIATNAAADTKALVIEARAPAFTFGGGLAVVDRNGLGFLVSPPGGGPAAGAGLSYAPAFTFGSGAAITDQNGYGTILGAASSQPSAVPPFIAHDIGAYPTRDAALTSTAGIARLSYNEGDNAGTQLNAAGTLVRWAKTLAGVSSIQTVELPLAPAPVASGVVEISHILGIGQSLGRGENGGTPDPDGIIDTTSHLMMFASGVNAISNSASATSTAFGPMVQLQSGGQDRGLWPRAGNRLRLALGATKAALMSSFAIGGAAYGSLKKDTAPYNRSLRGIMQAQFLGVLARVPVKLRATVCVHGETDRTASKATYRAWLITWQNDYQTDARAIRNEPTLILPMVISQVSSWTSYADATTGVPLAQLQVALEFPALFFLAGPKYHLPYSDIRHLTGAGYAQHGEEIGRALVAIANGGTWDGAFLPLYPASASRSGTVVTVATAGGVGDLVIDTTVVSDPGNYGISYRDTSGNPIAVSGVTVSGSTVQFTIASPAPGFAEFGLRAPSGSGGGPTTGPRTCIHDSSADTYANGSRMWKWMVHSEVAVS